jgi:hypothetical protein
MVPVYITQVALVLVEAGIARIFFNTVSGKEALLYLARLLDVFSLPTLHNTS